MRDRLPVLIGAALLVFVLLAWHFAQAPPPPNRPSLVYPALHSRNSQAVQVVLDAVDVLRTIRRSRRVAMGGGGDRGYVEALDRVSAEAAEALHYLEEIVREKGEDTALRVDLLHVVGVHRNEFTRRLLVSLLSDSEEVPALRVAALYALGDYRGDLVFETLRRVYLEDASFEGRYHLCVVLGRTGNPGSVPLLIDALEETGSPDLRTHAAQELGRFVEMPRVLEELRRRALADSLPLVRQNALRALSSTKDADSILKKVAATEGKDLATRRLAEALLKQREKAP